MALKITTGRHRVISEAGVRAPHLFRLRNGVRENGRFYRDLAGEMESLADAGGPTLARSGRLLAEVLLQAGEFEEAVGVDISSTMIEAANRFNTHGERCRYLVNTDDHLPMLDDDSFDFVYSNITLQHVPPAASTRYIAEFVRVLKPGGVALFQLPDGPYHELYSVPIEGPAGAGKSTVGRQLAESLGYEFRDSDREIQRRTGVDIPTIFEFEGEEGFRQRERVDRAGAAADPALSARRSRLPSSTRNHAPASATSTPRARFRAPTLPPRRRTPTSSWGTPST